MKWQRIAPLVTIVNLALLLVAMTQSQPSGADDSVLRGRMLELVDDAGKVRSSLKVEADGTVVFRLMDQDGTIRVKIGADRNGSGIVLLDETTEPGIHLLARRVGTTEKPNTTRITLTGSDGTQRDLEP
jgi:hypothetical protein